MGLYQTNFHALKDIINRVKWQPMKWEKTSANYLIGINIQNIQRTQKLNTEKPNNPIDKGINDPKEVIQIANKYKKKVQYPQQSEKCKSKVHLRFHLISITGKLSRI